MSSLEMARERVERASDLAGVLDASYFAFMTLLDVVKEQQDRGGPLFPAFVAAGVSVACGRFAIAEAPSLAVSAHMNAAIGGDDAASSAEKTAADIADLCRVIAHRLDDAAPTARDVRDRRACQEASRHAHALCARLGGAPLR